MLTRHWTMHAMDDSLTFVSITARKRCVQIWQDNKYERSVCRFDSKEQRHWTYITNSLSLLHVVEAWRDNFFLRLRRHAARVCICDHNTDIAIKHGDNGKQTKCQLAHAPMLIAFSGKRQFSWLFSPPLSKIERYGRQSRLPSGWPHELRADSEIWILPSSSGRAAMTTAQRMIPYQQLAESIHQIAWPNEPVKET